MNAEALLALAERVEQAPGPDRELADEVLLAFGYWKDNDGLYRGGRTFRWRRPGHVYSSAHNPLASLDAAMTLVPEGWTWDVDATAPEMGIDWTLWEPAKGGLKVTGTHEMPALALTAACLRARAASVDTLPKGQDSEAGLVRSKGGAVPSDSEGDAQTTQPIVPSHGPGRR